MVKSVGLNLISIQITKYNNGYCTVVRVKINLKEYAFTDIKKNFSLVWTMWFSLTPVITALHKSND